MKVLGLLLLALAATCYCRRTAVDTECRGADVIVGVDVSHSSKTKWAATRKIVQELDALKTAGNFSSLRYYYFSDKPCASAEGLPSLAQFETREAFLEDATIARCGLGIKTNLNALAQGATVPLSSFPDRSSEHKRLGLRTYRALFWVSDLKHTTGGGPAPSSFAQLMAEHSVELYGFYLRYFKHESSVDPAKERAECQETATEIFRKRVSGNYSPKKLHISVPLVKSDTAGKFLDTTELSKNIKLMGKYMQKNCKVSRWAYSSRPRTSYRSSLVARYGRSYGRSYAPAPKPNQPAPAPKCTIKSGPSSSESLVTLPTDCQNKLSMEKLAEAWPVMKHKKFRQLLNADPNKSFWYVNDATSALRATFALRAAGVCFDKSASKFQSFGGPLFYSRARAEENFDKVQGLKAHRFTVDPELKGEARYNKIFGPTGLGGKKGLLSYSDCVGWKGVTGHLDLWDAACSNDKDTNLIDQNDAPYTEAGYFHKVSHDKATGKVWRDTRCLSNCPRTAFRACNTYVLYQIEAPAGGYEEDEAEASFF